MGAYERGQAAWPKVQLDRASFEAHVARLAADETHAEDLYLTYACGKGDPAALQIFDALFLSHVPRFIARADSSPTVADEIKQRLRAELLVAPPDGKPRIASYAGRASLLSWLRVAAVRQLHRLTRRKLERTPAPEAELARLVTTQPNAELALMRARHGAELATALRGALATLPARERSLLKRHVLDGMTIDDLCSVYAVHRATVARWIVKVKQQLFAEATRQLQEKLALDSGEVESLYRALGSEIELSLGSFMRSGK
jgi:RNA polymerase sigma-70 factor (ECF subfamily)